MKQPASYETILKNKKTRKLYAYKAIERESMCGDSEKENIADKAMENFKKLSKKEILTWAFKQKEFIEIN